MTSRTILTMALTLACVASLVASDSVPGKLQDHPIAIVGGTIHTVSGGDIQQGTILFDKGKIIAVGEHVTLPQGTEVIDATGKHVFPGLISSATQIGLTEIEAVRATRDMTETGSINPNVRAETAVNPESELIPVARANGITMVVTTPTGGLLAGMSAMMMLDGWTWEDMTLKAPAALNVNWPEMTVSRSPWNRRTEEEQNKERESRIRELTNAFRDARAYWTAKKAEGTADLPYHDVDVRWESMIPVLEGKVPVVVWADEIRQIEAAVAWAESEQIQLIIGGGHDAWRVAELLKEKKIPVLAGAVYRLPDRRFEEYDEPLMLPAKLHQAGIPFSIITQDESGHERNLPYHAATAAAYGLPQAEALRSITLSPAEIFGVADRVGSLDPGKDATLIVATGDIFDIRSNVTQEYIQGRKVDLSSRHTRLYEKYLEKYRRTNH